MIAEFFNVFNAKRKADYTAIFGTLLASRIHSRFVIELYSVSDFYVEIWYDPVRSKVCTVKSYKSDKCFEPYLETITMDLH